MSAPAQPRVRRRAAPAASTQTAAMVEIGVGVLAVPVVHFLLFGGAGAYLGTPRSEAAARVGTGTE